MDLYDVPDDELPPLEAVPPPAPEEDAHPAWNDTSLEDYTPATALTLDDAKRRFQYRIQPFSQE